MIYLKKYEDQQEDFKGENFHISRIFVKLKTLGLSDLYRPYIEELVLNRNVGFWYYLGEHSVFTKGNILKVEWNDNFEEWLICIRNPYFYTDAIGYYVGVRFSNTFQKNTYFVPQSDLANTKLQIEPARFISVYDYTGAGPIERKININIKAKKFGM